MKEKAQKRLAALRILNKHFADVPKAFHLDNNQIVVVIDAMQSYSDQTNAELVKEVERLKGSVSMTYFDAAKLFDMYAIKSEVLIPIMDCNAFLKAIKTLIKIEP